MVSVSRMVHEALAAADALAGEGIAVEVIDLRTVAPLDMEPVLASVAKTSRLLVAHEAVVPFGIGAEIAATVAREAFWSLDAPIERVGAAATPPPYAPELERAWLPGPEEIAARSDAWRARLNAGQITVVWGTCFLRSPYPVLRTAKRMCVPASNAPGSWVQLLPRQSNKCDQRSASRSRA